MTLSTNTFISVEKVLDWGFIPELKIYGPCGRRMIRLDQIINMLNRNVRLRISHDWTEKIYLFVKEYNILCASDKRFAHLTKATTAEQLLESQLFKTSTAYELEDKKNNPLDDNLTQQEAIEIEKIHSGSIMRPKKIITRKTIKKPKMFEIFKDNTIDSDGENNKFENIELNI